VLPNVNANDGDVGKKRILVGRSDDLKFSGGWVKALTSKQKKSISAPSNPADWRAYASKKKTYEPAPARALDASGSRVELFLERVQRAPTLDDGRLERAILEYATMAFALGRGRRKVFPEERVVDVAYTDPRMIR
jgi:hypothetical protein